MSSWHFF